MKLLDDNDKCKKNKLKKLMLNFDLKKRKKPEEISVESLKKNEKASKGIPKDISDHIGQNFEENAGQSKKEETEMS